MQINEQETATIIAALRFWQREGAHSSGHEHIIASNGGEFDALDNNAIDDLCERLNFADANDEEED